MLIKIRENYHPCVKFFIRNMQPIIYAPLCVVNLTLLILNDEITSEDCTGKHIWALTCSAVFYTGIHIMFFIKKRVRFMLFLWDSIIGSAVGFWAFISILDSPATCTGSLVYLQILNVFLIFFPSFALLITGLLLKCTGGENIKSLDARFTHEEENMEENI